MNSLFLRLHNEQIEVDSEEEFDGSTLQFSWVVLNEESDLIDEGSSDAPSLLADVAEATGSESFARTVLFISDALTLFVNTEVPGRTSSQMTKALPFTVETYLSSDIDTMHIAHGSVRRGARVDCVAIEKDQMQTIVDALSAFEIQPSYCSTVGLQIQPSGNSIAVLADEDSVWIRSSEELAVMEPEVAVDAIPMIAQPSAEQEVEVHVRNFASNGTFSQSMRKFPLAELEDSTESLFVHVAQSFDPDVGINLMQGDFSVLEHKDIDTRRWLTTSVVALGCLLVYIGVLAGEGLWAGFRADALDQKAEELYQSIYGQSSGRQNPARRMRSHIGGGAGQSGNFELLLGEFATVVDRMGSSISVHSLNFRDVQKSLSTELETSSLEALDSLEKALESGSMNVEINTAEQAGMGVRANLTMSLKS